MEDCIFCRIVRGEEPSHIIWEDEKHIAFLSIFPNTEGFSVVATKEHYPSYFFDLDNEKLTELILASKTVAKLLDKSFDDVGRTALMMEGFGVDHVHTKLFPMHGTGTMEKWSPVISKNDYIFETYEGYISSHDGPRSSEAELNKTAQKIKETLHNRD